MIGVTVAAGVVTTAGDEPKLVEAVEAEDEEEAVADIDVLEETAFETGVLVVVDVEVLLLLLLFVVVVAPLPVVGVAVVSRVILG